VLLIWKYFTSTTHTGQSSRGGSSEASTFAEGIMFRYRAGIAWRDGVRGQALEPLALGSAG